MTYITDKTLKEKGFQLIIKDGEGNYFLDDIKLIGGSLTSATYQYEGVEFSQWEDFLELYITKNKKEFKPGKPLPCEEQTLYP